MRTVKHAGLFFDPPGVSWVRLWTLAFVEKFRRTTKITHYFRHMHNFSCRSKLSPNPRATQWTERTLKLSASIQKLSKNHFESVPVKDWCMSPHVITWNSGNKFRLTRPPTLPNFVALWQIVCKRNLDDLAKVGIGLHNCGLFIALYVDDILLLAPSIRGLVKLLRICENELDLLDMVINTRQKLIRRWDSERELLRSAPMSYPNSLK